MDDFFKRTLSSKMVKHDPGLISDTPPLDYSIEPPPPEDDRLKFSHLLIMLAAILVLMAITAGLNMLALSS